jgi:hypothetical protein
MEVEERVGITKEKKYTPWKQVALIRDWSLGFKVLFVN